MLTPCSRPAEHHPPALCSSPCTPDQKQRGPNKATPASTGVRPLPRGLPIATGLAVPTGPEAVPVLLDSREELVLHVPIAEAAEQGGQDGALGDPLTLDVGPGGQDVVSRWAGHGEPHVHVIHTCTDTATRTHRCAHTTPTWGNANQHICHTPHEALPHACPATRGTTPLHEGWWPWGGVRLQAFPAKEDLFPLVPCPRVCRPVLSSEVALLCSGQACLPRSTYEFIFYWNFLATSIVVTWNVIITKVHPLGRKFPEPGARSQPLRWPWPRA